MEWKIAIKSPEGSKHKYTTVGSFKKNKWDKMSLGIKVTPEVAKMILDTETGSWVNFYAFEDEPKQETDDNF